MRQLRSCVVTTMLLLLAAPGAHAQDDEKECQPGCRLGFECKEGTCVRAECRPACRKDFVCVDGECKSRCNPPCASNERCTDQAECVRMSSRRPDTETPTVNETPEPKPVEHAGLSEKYRPSLA